MSNEDVRSGIAVVARAHLGYEGPLDDDTALIEAMRLDSVRLLTLVAELENHFKVILEEGDEVGIERVSDLIAVLNRRLP